MTKATDTAIEELRPLIGLRQACKALGEPQAAWYRRHRRSAGVEPVPPNAAEPDSAPVPAKPRGGLQPRALSDEERAALREVLNSEAHVDEAPATVYAKLLDQGTYLGSISTMYRELHRHDEVTERRRVASHPARVKPELVATAPNQVWTWDITKLLGPVKWTYYYLYVIIDIWSRYVPGWLLATSECAALAKTLISTAVARQGIVGGQLSLHADNGSPMVAKPVAFLLADLGITQSHSRPHVSNDNPYSESQFRTLKYRPSFPERFDSETAAHRFCQGFFGWYNDEHRHSGIGLHTPADVHYGRAEALRARRGLVLEAAYAAHPDRFVNGPPEPPALPVTAWINQPHHDDEEEAQEAKTEALPSRGGAL